MTDGQLAAAVSIVKVRMEATPEKDEKSEGVGGESGEREILSKSKKGQ